LKTNQVRPQRRLLGGGGESAVEGDRISRLESHWQPLKQVCCFPGVFSDGPAPAPIPLLGGSGCTCYYYYYIFLFTYIFKDELNVRLLMGIKVW